MYAYSVSVVDSEIERTNNYHEQRLISDSRSIASYCSLAPLYCVLALGSFKSFPNGVSFLSVFPVVYKYVNIVSLDCFVWADQSAAAEDIALRDLGASEP